MIKYKDDEEGFVTLNSKQRIINNCQKHVSK